MFHERVNARFPQRMLRETAGRQKGESTVMSGNTLDGNPERPRRVEKPWGFELIFAHTDKYAGKILLIKKGCRLSLQYHEHKDESIYVQCGEIVVQLEGEGGQRESRVLQEGECLRIVPLTRHRLQAVIDTVLFKVSTPEIDDVRRVEDDYGRVG